ncbi:MAG: choice-of-anchor B family protein [Bacteroidota bacterium]
MRHVVPLFALLLALPASGQEIPCQNGQASVPGVGVFPCKDVDFVGHLPVASIATPGSPAANENNDLWGWTDPETGTEYALVGTQNGVGFVDLSTPTTPVLIGKLPAAAPASVWRDVKVYANHAFVVADNSPGHGMQVFDLTRLRDVTSPPVTFDVDARYTGFGSAHNIVINEATGFAYAVGSGVTSGQGLPSSCNPRGFHAVDIRTPQEPTFAACFSDVLLETGPRSPGYTHDAQCVIYNGPDTDHSGREICFASNEDVVTIFDVTDKGNVRVLSQAEYPNDSYTHQGWLTGDQRFFLANDELDERNNPGMMQRTIVLDVEDLDDPEFSFAYDSGLTSIDHNLYIRSRYAFESNYETGLRILDLTGIETGSLEEIAFFDTFPARDAASFNGQWSNYPFFESGLVIANDGDNGLFVLRPTSLVALADGDGPGTTAASLSEPVPNPTASGARLTLRVATGQPVRADLYDIAGRLVRRVFDGQAPAGQEVVLEVDTEGLPAAVYILRVTGDDFRTGRRLVVTR